MGIIDFIKGGVGELALARPDETKSQLVYKHVDPTIPNGAQLTVDADDAAVFFRDGSVVGTLRTAGAGRRHVLSSENIPFLNMLVDKFTGGDVFQTDLFFVTMRPVYDQRFGGELGVMEDPLLGEMVTPRIFGTYAFQIEQPEPFIIKYLGLGGQRGNNDLLRWVAGRFMNGIKAALGEVLVSEQKSMLELMPLQQKLAARFMEVTPDLTEIGCRIVQVGDFSINLDDEDERRLKDAQGEIGAAKRAARVANIGVAEARAEAQQKQFELDQQFQQDARYTDKLAGGDFGKYAAGAALVGAGEGMAQGGGDGGGMAAGASLGAGMGMAQAMAQNMGTGGPPQAALQPPPTAAAGSVTCSGCKAQVARGKFCSECGIALAPIPKFCSECGAKGSATGKFCAECGVPYP